MQDARLLITTRLRGAKHDFLHYNCVSISLPSIMLFSFFQSRDSEVYSISKRALESSSNDEFVVDRRLCPKLPAAAYIPSDSQLIRNSNQRTRNQFRPRNATKGTSSYQLRQYAEATLGGGSLRKIVKLPEGEDENEWLAVNSKSIF
jgi:hypothetical protein